MQVLFIGDTSPQSTSIYYATNLMRLGCSVYLFDPQLFHARTLKQKISISFYKTPHRKLVASVKDRLVQLCQTNTFDVIFVMNQNFLGKDTLDSMRKVSRKAPTIVYHSHDNNFCRGVLTPINFGEFIRAFDIVFTTKSQNVERYRNVGQFNSIYIPSAFEPTLHAPVPDSQSVFAPHLFPVTFVGTYDKSRDAVVENVGWDRLYVWGDRWNKFPGYSEQRAHIQTKSIYFRQYADILSHSEISLGLLREEAEDRHTQRTFEIPACGTLQLAPRNDEILSYFTEDKEIVCFDSPAELKDKIDFYLNHPAKRKEIAKRGYERCYKGQHTYLDRVQEILKAIEAKKLASLRPKTRPRKAKAA